MGRSRELQMRAGGWLVSASVAGADDSGYTARRERRHNGLMSEITPRQPLSAAADVPRARLTEEVPTTAARAP
ncbi:MAG TPA: hypothetical protein VJ738_13135 [Steroidobacteraceae bacterium]|nr:hypothetical protein [Steroidobacteraceae bacterium]